MFSGFPQQTGTQSERKLCRLYSSLNDESRLTLMKFAEFLIADAAIKDQQIENNADEDALASILSNDSQLAAFPEPKIIPAPDNENIIKAIKRISAMYYMVDKSQMLDKTSTLMTEHLMRGRPMPEVLADLETGFKQEYEKLYEAHHKKRQL